MKRKVVKKIISYLFIFLSFVVLLTSIYINYKFNSVSFEQLLFSISNSKGTSVDAVLEGTIFVVLISLVLTIVVSLICKLLKKKFSNQIVLKMKIAKREKCFKVLPLSSGTSLIISILSLVFAIFIGLGILSFYDYLSMQFQSSTIFEDYYVDAKDVDIDFPEEKQNLIYIYVESLEMTAASKLNGGAQETSYISDLESLALENINFSNTSSLGGAYANSGSTWTAGALISQTAGVPLKVSLQYINDYNGFGDSLPGVYTLGDILADNGYTNYFLMGSNASFGGRKDYFTYHGDYQIHDYIYAIEQGWIPEDYFVWWGYEDTKLFEYAKKELTEIAEKGEPFNYTMLTADTHFIDGYLDEECPTEFDSRYANVFNCSSLMVYEFVEWIKEQDFYENTTIVITGDHLTMQNDFFANIDSSYTRNIYNTIINSKVDTKYSKNRQFTILDMFPTTLAAIGCEVEGDRLALGTNLFSGKKTLAEEFGLEALNTELDKKSFYYDEIILGDTYYEMLEK